MNPNSTSDHPHLAQILADEEQFRQQLQIDSELFEQIRQAKNLADFMAKIDHEGEQNLAHRFSTLSGLGQFSFALMVASQTMGWTPSSLKVLKSEKIRPDKLFEEGLQIHGNQSPHSPDSLLGSIAILILEWMIYPGLRIAYADGDFSVDEKEAITDLYVSRWGYQKEFLSKVIEATEKDLERFDYEILAKNFHKICVDFPEINADDTRQELLKTIRYIVAADGITHPTEEKELEQLNACLIKAESGETETLQINNFWDYIFRSGKKQKKITTFDILREIPLFSNLTKGELKLVARIIHLRRYKKGEFVFLKDDPGAAMFIIKSGSLKIVVNDIRGNEIPLATLKGGTFVGELALLDNSPRSASAKAMEETEALAFFRSEFNKLLRTHPIIGSKIMRELAIIIGQRLKATNEQLYKH